eukprot:993708-Rhodomonas_salina.3
MERPYRHALVPPYAMSVPGIVHSSVSSIRSTSVPKMAYKRCSGIRYVNTRYRLAAYAIRQYQAWRRQRGKRTPPRVFRAAYAMSVPGTA